MDQIGVVTTINGNKCEVLFKRTSACGGNCSSCASSCESKYQSIIVDNTIGAELGENVKIITMNKKIYLYLVFLYVLPVMLFIISFFVANIIFEIKEGYSFLISLISLLIFAVVIRLIDKYFFKLNNHIKIKRI